MSALVVAIFSLPLLLNKLPLFLFFKLQLQLLFNLLPQPLRWRLEAVLFARFVVAPVAAPMVAGATGIVLTTAAKVVAVDMIFDFANRVVVVLVVATVVVACCW